MLLGLSLENKLITVLLLILFGFKGIKDTLLFKFLTGKVKYVIITKQLQKFLKK